MGCCQSTPELPRHTSRDNVSTPMVVRYDSGDATGVDVLRLAGNKPLIPHGNVIWTSPTPITAAELARRREDFWDTWTDGRRETREVLRLIVSVADPATAQAISDDAGLRIPTGNLVDGVCDAYGNIYRLPPFVISEPTNLIPYMDPADMMRKEMAVPRESMELATSAIQISETTAAGAPPNAVFRYSHNGLDKKVFLPPDASGRLARSLAIANLESTTKPNKLHIFYLGRMITDGMLIKDVVRGSSDSSALPVLQVMLSFP